MLSAGWRTILPAFVGMVFCAGPALAQPAGPQRLDQADRVGTFASVIRGSAQQIAGAAARARALKLAELDD
jgi:hypothetical protein